MSNYLKIDHLSKSFARGSSETEVLHDVTLAVERGEYVSIIGHSGCGKSTLLNIVAGLLPATLGGVLLENREVNAPGPDRAVVFQNHSLLPWLTVYDNVRLAVDKVFASTKSRKERHAWTMHNLELVQMAHAKDKRPAEISGGMKQRVGLARARSAVPGSAHDSAARLVAAVSRRVPRRPSGRRLRHLHHGDLADHHQHCGRHPQHPRGLPQRRARAELQGL